MNNIWACKIGGEFLDHLPNGADYPMRKAISEAYTKLTGKEADFCFSGWGAQLDEYERAVVENRPPMEKATMGMDEIFKRAKYRPEVYLPAIRDRHEWLERERSILKREALKSGDDYLRTRWELVDAQDEIIRLREALLKIVQPFSNLDFVNGSKLLNYIYELAIEALGDKNES